MKTRILAAAALLPLLLVVILVLPEIFTALLVGAMAAVGAWELLHGTGLVQESALNICTMLAAFAWALWSYFGCSYPALLIGLLVFGAALYGQMLLSHAQLDFRKVGVCLAGGVLIPFMLTALVRLICADHGRFLVLIPFVMAFLSDTGAYFVGCFLGKHKLAPNISPKKTVEGLVGGVLGAIVGMIVYCLVLERFFGFTVNYVLAAVYGLLGSLAAVFGDLSFSAIKRQVGIKDYGNLIPGHGGILDRFDSMSVVAPLAEALLLLLPLAVK